jgi:stringent starvation protein B
MEDENKNKYDFLLSLLSEGDAMVCLDARHPEVDVPHGHKSDPSLNLILNLNFKRPLDIQKEGVFVTLAFQGRPHPCVVPFDAIWAIYDPTLKKGQVWEESLPKDINLEEHLVGKENMKPQRPVPSVKQGGKKNVPGKNPPAKRDRSHLRVVK